MIYTETTNCNFSNPISYDNTAPTLKTHAFYFKTTVCTINDGLATSSITLNAYNPTTTIASSSNIAIYGSMSAGEVLIALFLFMLLWLKLMELVARGLSVLKTKKTFLGYSGGDVEIREDR